MFSFIRSSACLGRKPSHLAMVRCHGRASLTAQLLRERTVARFIVAPDGYGKTAAVMEYADVVFGYDHVFWIRCDSPCFLRDLDADRIASVIQNVDASAALVIFEDLPRLDDERRDRLSDLLDTLLSAGLEVIVTCAPSCDSYGELQHDRLCITSEMLLLTDDELSGEGMALQTLDKTPSCRTPCMVWSKEGEKLLLSGLRREELPADLVVGALLLLMLGQGSFEELEQILGAQWAARVIECFAESYPYAGINGDERAFSAAPITVKGLATSIGRGFASLLASCPNTDRDQLLRRIADTLLLHGQWTRACELVQAFCSVKGETEWLAERGKELLAQGALGSILSLHVHLDRRRKEKVPSNELVALMALTVIGDDDEARTLARRILVSKTSEERHRTLAWCVMLLLAPEQDRLRLQLLAGEFLEACYRTDPLVQFETDRPDPEGFADARLLLERLVAIGKGTDPMQLWRDYAASQNAGGRFHNAAFEVCSFTRLLEALAAFGDNEDTIEARMRADAMFSTQSADSLVGLARQTLDRVETLVRSDDFGVVEAVAIDRLLDAFQSWPEGAKPAVYPWIYDVVNDRMLIVRRERRNYEGVKRRRLTARTIDAKNHPERKGAKALAGVLDMMPIMTVNLFGGLSVAIGDRTLGARELTRHKSRQLLALLVLHHGREIPKERLIGMLWPDHDPLAAAKSLYGAWSKLKKAIEIDGVCPYIYRSPSGFRIVKELVDSDVYHFEGLCRSMLFASTTPVDWQETFRRITEEFGDDLLPGERDNATLDVMRGRFRSQLVDGLVTVSHRLEREGEAQGAIWFAREAIDRDPSREDAHMALMRAQIAANQRSSAIASYFNCRTELAERLGLDPSPAMIELYRSIIEE